MKIEKGSLLDQTVQKEQPLAHAKVTTSFSKVAKSKMDALDPSIRVEEAGYDKESLKSKSALEELEEKFGGQMDAAARKDQMAVLANTMTPEDYQKLQEEGFSGLRSDSNTIVTVVDKIKAQLAKAGVDISYMGDSLTREQLEELAGSAAAVSQLERSFEDADLPATEENMAEGLKAYQQAEQLQALSEGAIKYMLDNHLPPSISNLYMAEFSGSASYTAPQEETIDFEALKGQMEQIISAAGGEADEKALADGQWMVQNNIALTADNFSYLQKLNSLRLPADGSQIAAAIATAVAEGDRPTDAMLLPEYSATAQAERAVEIVTEASDEDIAYLVANDVEITVSALEYAIAQRKQGKTDVGMTQAVMDAAEESGQDAGSLSREGFEFLRARRMLEETRLAMTTEANRALIKRGIAIETKPLEELVASLKEQENHYYASLLGEGKEVTDASMTALFEETSRKVEDLKGMPAYLLGMRGRPLDTVNALHEAGSVLKDTFEKAGESYEALMTAPRKDLGDSIQKAFANVEDILADLGLEGSEANKRAVRILAYNSLPINEESVMTMKAADERVQRTFANLTPATVRELIHQGDNPLDMDLELLNQKAEAIRAQSNDADTERFSEYLWKLEQSHGISPEERESFIGVYRLMNQIERTDGAAIGALVSQGAEFTMRNLLTAVRSAKKSGMDYTVDDEFAGVDRMETESKSIVDQIETAYQANCMKDVMETLTPVTMKKLLDTPEWENYTPEQLKQVLEEYAKETVGQENALDQAYAQSQLEELQQAAATDEEIYRLLERFEIPNTVEHVLAANRLINRRNQVFAQMFRADGEFSGESVDFEALKTEILERFGNAVKTPKELAAAQEELAETAENVMKTMLADDEHITSMDIRELKLMNAQLSIAGKMAENEEYTIPVLVGNEVTNISLKIVRGEKKKGIVDVMFETAKAGKVAASIEAKENGVSGLIAVDNMDTKRLLEERLPEITKGLGEEEGDLQVSFIQLLNFSRFSRHKEAASGSGEDAYEVQTARLYHIAKGFIEAVKELEF